MPTFFGSLCRSHGVYKTGHFLSQYFGNSALSWIASPEDPLTPSALAPSE